MIIRNSIFNKRFLGTFGVIVAIVMTLPVFAATTKTGCETDKNDRINPEIALCSTHTYNAGWDKNPSSESDKQYMRDVIALKTTFMTQQMYKQYEYLEATLKRLKTQLEKAVLTTKIQMATDADTSSSSYSGGISGNASFRSNDPNIFISGARNCNNEISTTKVYECLHSNMNTISTLSNNGTNPSVQLRKQLKNDYKVAKDNCENCETKNKDNKCESEKTIIKATDFRECLDELKSLIRKGNQQAQLNQRRMNSYGGKSNDE